MLTRSFMFALLAVFVLSACNSQSASVKNLKADEFEKGIAQSNVQLVDVRTPEEYSEKHLNAANNINIDGKDFEKRLDSLDKSKPLYLYCLAGTRSAKAGNIAVKAGFKEVYNLDKGITAWMNEKKPVVTESGVPPSNGMSFDDYLTHIKQPGKLVLVDFSAVWCGPCKLLKPIVEKVIDKNQDKVQLFAVDVDKNPEVSRTMHIDGIPLLVLYKEGKEVWRNLGLTDEGEINSQIKKFSK